MSAETMATLFLASERAHERDAVLQQREQSVEGGWKAMPDWRFDRHVLRVALYLRERIGMRQGDRLAIVAPIGVEPLTAEWAGFVLGLTVGAVDPRLGEDGVRTALHAFAPRAVLAVDARMAEATHGLVGVERVILARGVVQRDSWVTYADVLDLGGTLDTAERAHSLRANARTIDVHCDAMAWRRGTSGQAEWATLSQGEAAASIRRIWAEIPSHAHAVRYFADAGPQLETRLALHACVADGLTRIAFGAPDVVDRTKPRARPGWLTRVTSLF
jgi:long-subunit acyl-CoA synthetase (AMP-forming)